MKKTELNNSEIKKCMIKGMLRSHPWIKARSNFCVPPNQIVIGRRPMLTEIVEQWRFRSRIFCKVARPASIMKFHGNATEYRSLHFLCPFLMQGFVRKIVSRPIWRQRHCSFDTDLSNFQRGLMNLTLFPWIFMLISLFVFSSPTFSTSKNSTWHWNSWQNNIKNDLLFFLGENWFFVSHSCAISTMT